MKSISVIKKMKQRVEDIKTSEDIKFFTKSIPLIEELITTFENNLNTSRNYSQEFIDLEFMKIDKVINDLINICKSEASDFSTNLSLVPSRLYERVYRVDREDPDNCYYFSILRKLNYIMSGIFLFSSPKYYNTTKSKEKNYIDNRRYDFYNFLNPNVYGDYDWFHLIQFKITEEH